MRRISTEQNIRQVLHKLRTTLSISFFKFCGDYMLQLNLNSMHVRNTLSFTWEILKHLSTTMRGRKTSEFFFLLESVSVPSKLLLSWEVLVAFTRVETVTLPCLAENCLGSYKSVTWCWLETYELWDESGCNNGCKHDGKIAAITWGCTKKRFECSVNQSTVNWLDVSEIVYIFLLIVHY